MIGCTAKIHHSSQELHRQDQFDYKQLEEGSLALIAVSAVPELEEFRLPLATRLVNKVDSLGKEKFRVIGWDD